MEQADLLILGGGLVGLTLALALDAHGMSSVVVDPADPEATLAAGFDGRASAIASASWRLLDAIGVADALRAHSCPIRRIEVRDGLQRRPLDFTPRDGEPLGMMMENRTLRRALRQKALAARHVILKAPARAMSVERGTDGVMAVLDDGTEVRAALLAAAEGRGSPTRAAAGIRVASWAYDHVAIISAFEHAIPHGAVAHEIFYPDGPFALLPMVPGNRTALVWTVRRRDAPGVLALNDHAFALEVHRRTGGLLGELSAIAPRSSYPLGFHHAATLIGERLALVGDAAHGIHPIAGQGVNLGFRDVAALTEVLVEGSRLGLDPGDAQLLARYQRWRGFDTLMVASVTDMFVRLFGLPGRAPQAVRRLGLGAVDRIGPLKSLFMAEARGETGELPRLLKGLAV